MPPSSPLSRRQSTLLLAAYVALTALGHMRFGVPVAAWLAPLPALTWLRLRRGAETSRPRRDAWSVMGLSVLGWNLAVAKICTDPIPLALAPMYGLPLGLAFGGALAAYDALRRRGVGPWAFPALMVVAEWGLAQTPLATWGAGAYAHVEDLALLQLTSLGGLGLVAALVHAVPAVVDHALAHRLRDARRPVLTLAAALLAAYSFGSLRLAALETSDAPSLRVAALATDQTMNGLPLPAAEDIARWDGALSDRTRRAAAAGAQLVVWPEAATLVAEHDVGRWLDARAAEARELGVDLVAAFVTPVSLEPLVYENRYAWFGPDGSLEHVYRKARPVPTEPAIAGDGPSPTVARHGATLAGAICYDFDHSDLARAHARAGVGLVALPSSDWAGIAPFHTQMAAVRAIEGGFSIVRATRMGQSAAVTPTGRPVAWQAHPLPLPPGGPDVLIADLPLGQVATPYTALGDWPVALAGLLLAAVAAAALRRRARSPHADAALA